MKTLMFAFSLVWLLVTTRPALCEDSKDRSGENPAGATTHCGVALPAKIPLGKWEMLEPKGKAGFKLDALGDAKWLFHDDAGVAGEENRIVKIHEAVDIADAWLRLAYDLRDADVRCEGAVFTKCEWRVTFVQYYQNIPTHLSARIALSGRRVVRCSSRISTIASIGEPRDYLSAERAAIVMQNVHRRFPESSDYIVDPRSLVLQYGYSVVRHSQDEMEKTLVPLYREGEDGNVVVDAFVGKGYVDD